MEPGQAKTDSAPLAAEIVQSADLIDKGNELLKKAKEVARRIEDRCREAMRSNPDRGKPPPSQPT
jgi:hypothetical protein